MSLILEALKKSEAKRRLGDAPDLGTPFTTPARRRSILPYLGIVILLVSAGGWWLLRPEVPRQPSPTQSGRTAIRSHAVAASAKRVGKPTHKPKSTKKQYWVAAQRQSEAVNGSQKPSRTQRRAHHATGKSRLNTVTQAAVNKPWSAQSPAAAQPTSAATQTPANGKPATPAAKGNVTRTGRGSGSTAPAASQNTLPPGVPMYYELPYNVRQSLPNLKLSMHVYSKDPAQRFVILNNSRMVEGDKTSDEVTLQTIRPDGVILEFQGQRFFLPRDGF